MAPTEPSGTTMSDRPARRRPGRRHGATTRSIGSVDRLSDRPSVPQLSRGPVTPCRGARPVAPKSAGGTWRRVDRRFYSNPLAAKPRIHSTFICSSRPTDAAMKPLYATWGGRFF
jgi:hypothetical protein